MRRMWPLAHRTLLVSRAELIPVSIQMQKGGLHPWKQRAFDE